MTSSSTPLPTLVDEADLAKFRNALAVVILPTLNEEQGLSQTLGGLPFARFDEPSYKVQTLVIDGGSTDGTLQVAKDWDIPVLRQVSRGKGGAMLEAVAWVHRMGIPFVVVLDADATYPPDRILPALDLLRGGTDLVMGVRRPVWGPPTEFKDLVHRVGNLIMSCAASLLTHRPILDLCSGFWGVSTRRFMELDLDDSSFAIEAELVLKSIRRGLSIHQIHVEYHERVGQAKLRALRDGSQIFRTILRQARTDRRPAEKSRAPARWARDLPPIELPSHATELGSRPATSLWSRSGGWKTSALPLRGQFPSLLVLTSRLNFHPEHQELTLLSANGFHAVEYPRDRPEPNHRPSHEGLSKTRGGRRAPPLPPLDGFSVGRGSS